MSSREVVWMNESVIPELSRNGWIVQTNEIAGNTGIPDLLVCKNNTHAYIELKIKRNDEWDIFEPSQYGWQLRYLIAGNKNCFTLIKIKGSNRIIVLNIENQTTAHFLRNYPTVWEIWEHLPDVAECFQGDDALLDAIRHIEYVTNAYKEKL